MVFQVIWFVLWSVLWAVYFMLDGFDLGAGILQAFVGKTDTEKRMVINTFGPFWDGNEVWLLTAGGATFAAFPTTYALMFSYLYTPLLIVLFALILRGVSFEFRGKLESKAWRNLWDVAIFVGSFIPALLFGVAFGNIFQGLPMDAAGYHGNLFYLLNPYGLLTGVFFVLLFVEHGALWLTIKTEGVVSERAARSSERLWGFLFIVAAAFLVYTYFSTSLYSNYFQHLYLFIIPLLAVGALLCVRFFIVKGRYRQAFWSSCVTIVTVTLTGVTGLYPNLIPSSMDPAYSLTIFNSSSSPYTLKIMTVVALIFVPIVIAYQIWTYSTFRHKVKESDISEGGEAY